MPQKNNEFLQSLFRECTKTNYLELRIFSGSKPKCDFLCLENINDVSQRLDEITDTENVYFGIATRNNNKRGTKSDCAELPALFIDIDFGREGHKKESLFSNSDKVMEHIKRADLGETVIVNSGHGFHIYWFLSKPLQLNDNNITRAENVMKKLARYLGGDTAYDVSRILRVPGSLNVKGDVPIPCSIVKANYSNTYSIEDLEYLVANKPLFHIPFDKITTDNKKINVDEKSITRSSHYLSAIYGSNQFGKDDRSEIDAKITHYLIQRDFTDNEIELLFHYYPTSGKYHERADINLTGAKQYLLHTIKNLREYNMVENKENEITSIMPEQAKKNSNYQQLNIIHFRNMAPALPSPSQATNDYAFAQRYVMQENAGELGYYYIVPKTGELKRMTNFIIKFDSQIQTVIDGETVSFFNGELVLTDRTVYNFDNLPANTLVTAKDLMLFITNLGGAKIQFESSHNDILAAIKFFNEDTPVVKAIQYGYTENLNGYNTEELRITGTSIIKEFSPIKHYEMYGTNKLSFELISKSEMLELKKQIISDFLTFDEFDVMYPLFSFTMLPLIHPFIKDRIPEKTYMMLQGTSGSGKSLMTKLAQRFYGEYENLISWSSTTTSINVIGHSHKDALFTVDDLKIQNLPTDMDKRKAMQLVQNYADNIGRQRSNTSLKIRDAKYIRGFLLISAEDVVFTESSTIARGIIIPIKSKKLNFNLVNRINTLSNKFSGLTPYFIQHVLKYYDKHSFKDIFDQQRNYISAMLEKIDAEIPADNLARTLNNFSQLATSFKVVNSFLFAEDEEEQLKNRNRFETAIRELIVSNLNRIQQFKPDEKFIRTFWDMLDASLIKLHNIDLEIYDKSKVVGYFKYSKDYYKLEGKERLQKASVKICINLDEAFRAVNMHLQNDGGIGTTKDALKNKLITDGMIKVLDGGRVSFTADIKKRGVEWVGKYPRELFGLKEQPSIQDKDQEDLSNNMNELDLLLGTISDRSDSIKKAPLYTYPDDEDTILP